MDGFTITLGVLLIILFPLTWAWINFLSDTITKNHVRLDYTINMLKNDINYLEKNYKSLIDGYEKDRQITKLVMDKLGLEIVRNEIVVRKKVIDKKGAR